MAGDYLSGAQNPIRLHPLHNVLYTCIQSTNIHTGQWGGGVEPERKLEGQKSTKLGRKYQHDRLCLQSINSDKHLPKSSFTVQFFWMKTFCFGVYIVD